MGFSGELEAIGFGTVFQGIQSNRSSGTLRVFNERHDLYVYFLEGKVTMAAPLQLAAEQVTTGHGRTKTRRRDRRKIEGLLRTNSKEAQTLRAELQVAVCERIYDAFTWSTTRFEFNEGEPREHIFSDAPADAGFRLEVEPILMEAARREDEWARIHRQIRSHDEIFVQIATAGTDGDAPAGLAADVLTRMNGETPLSDIIADLPQQRFAVCKATADLLRAGWIQPLPIEERVQVARRLAGRGEVDSAVRVLTGALEQERNDPVLHESLGELQDQAGRSNKAARSFGLAADAYLVLGQETGALASFAKAIEKAPRDTALRERQLRLLLERRQTSEALQHGSVLAELYAGRGLAQDARDTYARLVRIAPDDEGLKEHLARCEHELGNSSEAVKLYRPLVAKALKGRQFANGVRLLHEVLKAAPGHRKAQRTLTRLESGRHAESLRRRKRLRRTAVYGAGAGLVLWAVGYEFAARSHYNDAQRSNIALIAGGHHLEAVDAFRNVRETYPWSLAQIEAGGLIDGLIAEQLREIERRRPDDNPMVTLKKLDSISALQLSPDHADRVRREIARLRLEKRVLDHATALSDPKHHDDAKAALLGIADPMARHVLQKLLAHPNEEVRFVALAPLTNMQSPRSIPHLIELLKDRSTRVRDRARTALAILTDRSSNNDPYQDWIRWWRAEGRQTFHAK